MRQNDLPGFKQFFLNFFWLLCVLGGAGVLVNCSHSPEIIKFNSKSDSEALTKNSKSVLHLSTKELTDDNPFHELFTVVEGALSKADLESADKFLQDLIEEKGRILAIRAWIARYYNKTHNYTRASILAEEILQLITDEEAQIPELAYAKAIALISLGQSAYFNQNFDKAVRYLKDANSVYPGLVTPYVIMGDVYLQKHEYKSAEEFFYRALDRDSENTHALAGVVAVLWQFNHREQALEILQNSLFKYPKDSFLHEQRGKLQYEMGNYIDAETDFRFVLQTKPWDVFIWMELGNSLDMQNKYSEAESAYQKAIELDPSRRGIHFKLAVCYFYQKKYMEALAEIKSEEKLIPVEEPGVYILKIDLLNLLNLKDEIRDAEKQLEILQAKR